MNPTDKKLASLLILVESKENIHRLNSLNGSFSELILGRQGIVLHDRQINIISLVLEGNADEIGAFAGQIGRLTGIKVKSVQFK
jgi:putative iron-only hydrogenase system regulator